MKEVPEIDRPREKLMRAGADALGDNELVALVLGTGTRRRDALAVAQDLLATAGGAEGLLAIGVDELQRVSGVGMTRAARLLAAVELGRRALVRPAPERALFRNPFEMAHYLMPRYGGHRVERFGVMLLDTRHRLIRTTIVSSGAPDASLAQPREVFREALLASSYALVLFHNHPSGDPRPSRDDIDLTRRLAQAGDVMGVRVLDHIILGSGRYFSFHQAGRML